jgi:hypothetical protein
MISLLPKLALLVGLCLSKQGMYEEGLPLLAKSRTTEELFYKAVAEHQLTNYTDMVNTIGLLRSNFTEKVPERYDVVCELMLADARVNNKTSLISSASIDMRNAQRRLALRKSGPTTQKHEAEALRKLDDEIRKTEDEIKKAQQAAAGLGSSNGKAKPKLGPGSQGATPMPDSMPGGTSGPGRATEEVVKGLARKWGALPEKDRAKALAEITRDLPPKHREAVEEYFRALARSMNHDRK